jgi:hypothetical protein
VVADGFRIDAAWLDALDRYVDGLLTDTAEVAQDSARYLQDEVVDQAREHPEWATMADGISAWSEDGRLTIGVHDSALSSQAFALEYGDENRPPTPLFRKAAGLVPKVQDRMERELLARRGVPPIKGMKV